MMRRLALAVLLALPALAQTFSENVQVTVVEVPVTVVDRAGKPVRGLTKDEFEVAVDGRKVPISGFDVVDIAALASQPATTPLPPVAYRNFLLLFDLTHSSPGTIGRAQTAAKELVVSGLTRRDLAAVATFSVEAGLNVVTSFTSDRALLVEAIETLGDPAFYKTPDPLRIAMLQKTAGPTPNELGKARALAVAALEEQIADKNMLAGSMDEESQRTRVRQELRKLGSVARLLDGLAGQKQVVLLSEGFDASIVVAQRKTAPQQAAVERGELWQVTSEEHFGSSAASAEIREMAELFRRSDVTLHAIDVKGLRSDVDARTGAMRVSNEALHLLTRPTGGTVFENATRLSESFATLLAQQEVVYVLAFESKRTFEPDRFHAVKVKVRAAGNPRVSHRQGFYEKSPLPDAPAQEALALAEVLMKDANVHDVALSVVAVPMPASDDVPVVVELPGPKLLAEARQERISVDLVVYAFDENNQIRDSVQQRLGLDVARHGEKLRAGGVRYVTSLKVPPGKHVIKALARVDETGRLGLARAVVTVPATTNAIFLGEPASWIHVAAPERGDGAVEAFTADGRRLSPVASPSLKGGEVVHVAMYGASGDVRAELLTKDGLAEALTLPVVATDERKVLLDLTAPPLTGEYRLRLTAANSRVDLPFRVE